MAIKFSVGKNGTNQSVDAKVIQAALNSVSVNFGLAQPLTVDGVFGKKSIDAVELFQKNVVKLERPDGRIDPNGKTLKALKEYQNKKITNDIFLAIMAHGRKQKIDTFYPHIKSQFPKYEINTPFRCCHFLAQIGHESLSLTYTEELASGQAYEGRKDLGNTEIGDGARFKGRGLIQLTGRHNYKNYGHYVKVDFLTQGQEKLVSTSPNHALGVALWFWTQRKLNVYADKDDLIAITRRVNGGINGLEDRREYLTRARFFLV